MDKKPQTCPPSRQFWRCFWPGGSGWRWPRRVILGMVGFILAVVWGLIGLGVPAWSVDTPNFGILDFPTPETQVQPDGGVVAELDDPEEFQAFLDSIFNPEFLDANAPGAVVSVVKDGEIFFQKGYGYADLEREIPVDGDRTLFRVASLSKLFTATATMQLYEQGLIDLDDDITQYLDFELENPFDQPVTFAQLMTHTGGTTKRRIGLAARTADEMPPLGDYLRDHTPPIVYPPGKLYSYSSHAIALLGYLVERISGEDFNTYVQNHLLQPLDMDRSTFLQPPPENLQNDLATGYQRKGGEFEPVPYLYLNIAPAASLQATATDMAHFMIAHLQLGQYEDQRILEPDTARLMHETHFVSYPGLPGTGYGFRERLVNGTRSIGHLGSLRGYSSSLTLIPNENVGIFIASNSFSGVHSTVLNQFFNRYFTDENPAPPIQAIQNVDLSQFTGVYRDLEYPRHTAAKLSAPYEQIWVRGSEYGTLEVQPPSLLFAGQVANKTLAPIGPQLFKRLEDDALAAFAEDEDGRVTYGFNLLWPKIGTYERVAWYEVIWFHLTILVICGILFATGAIAWIILPLLRQLIQRKRGEPAPWLYGARGLAGTVGLLNLLFLVGLPLYLWHLGVWKLAYGMPPVAIAFFCLPLITTALTVALPIGAVTVWRDSRSSTGSRIHYGLVTLAAIAFIPVLVYWNLLGFQF
ncbi:MAG: serine hydrolase domain-containing protein [Synechococcales bacterium]|nr:serine hydrolase domain-containing protein [Synechococcales bacterium]